MFFDVNRFHFLALITWQFTIFFASQMIFGIFSGYVPKWRCGDDQPFAKDCVEYERCNGTVTWEDNAFASTALEFDWICGSKGYMKEFYSQVQFAGVLIGTLSFGTISDAVGRKPVATSTLAIGITMNFITGLAPSWQILLVIRFFLGLSIGGCLVVVCTFVMEMLLPKQRMALRAFFNWGVARLMVTLICYLLPQWRAASIACALTALPALLIIGRTQEMVESEKKIARWAGIPYKPVRHSKIEHSKSFCEIIHTPGIFRRLVVLWIMWFTASICGYATDLNSNTISGDLYWNQVVFSVLIAVSKMILVTVDTLVPGFSRRLLHQGSQFVVCICFMVLTGMTIYAETQSTLFLIVNVMGTMFIEYTWDACYLCAIESMETPCRASATGSCSFVARIGAIMAPFLNHLNKSWGGSVYLTVTIMGALNLVISYLMLVETKNVNLDNVHMDREPSPEESTIMLEDSKNGNEA